MQPQMKRCIMLISADLVVQAIFISAIFLAAISIPKQLYYMLYLRYCLAQLKHRDKSLRELYKEGKISKEKYEEYLRYYQGQKGRERRLMDEMETWEQFVKSMHEPIIENITSQVLIVAILLIPQNFFSDQISSILLGLFAAQGAVTISAIMSIWFRKASASLDEHIQEAVRPARKKVSRKRLKKESP